MSGTPDAERRALLAWCARRGVAPPALLEVVADVDSTNSALLRAHTPRDGLAVMLADAQHGGRGRLGRTWASPPGANLYLSVSRCFDGGLERLAGLGLVAGVAVAQVVHRLGAPQVRVKWPNDLVVEDGPRLRKLGGILVEGGLQDGVARAVIGIGLNLHMPPAAAAGIDQPWVDLEALLGEARPPRAEVAAAVIAQLGEALTVFAAEGLAPTLAAYRACDALAGSPVVVMQGDTELRGEADGLDADGALRVRTADGLVRVHGGEVRVRRTGG